MDEYNTALPGYYLFSKTQFPMMSIPSFGLREFSDYTNYLGKATYEEEAIAICTFIQSCWWVICVFDGKKMRPIIHGYGTAITDLRSQEAGE